MASSEQDKGHECTGAECSSSDEEPLPPRVVGVQVAPEGPIYELPPPPRKVPPAPPVRRDSLQAPQGESLLPPPSVELFLSDEEEDKSPGMAPVPIPPKKFPKGIGLRLPSAVQGTAEGAAVPPGQEDSSAELTAEGHLTPPTTSPGVTKPGGVRFADAPPTVVLVPLSPEGFSGPRKKSATRDNFLETRETSWKFTPGRRTRTVAADRAGAPKDCKEETMTSSSDTDDLEDLPPPPPECGGLEDSTDSENIYEDIGPYQGETHQQHQPVPEFSVGTASLIRPPKNRKFARSLQDILNSQVAASLKPSSKWEGLRLGFVVNMGHKFRQEGIETQNMKEAHSNA